MFHGSIVALVTPMAETGEIDYPAVDRLIDFHLAHGTDGLVIGGTTGESACLTDDEFLALLDRAIQRVAGRIPVIAGTGCPATKKTIAKTRLAEAKGANAALVVTPYYNRPEQAGLVAHYQAIHDATGIPLIIYNVPGRTGVDLLPESTAILAELPNMVAIKEANSQSGRINELLELVADKMTVLSGDDSSACRSMLEGAQGVVSVVANVVPASIHALCEAACSSQAGPAKLLDDSLRSLYDALALETNPQPVKWALHEMGLTADGIRLPLLPLAAEHRRTLLRILSELKLLDRNE